MAQDKQDRPENSKKDAALRVLWNNAQELVGEQGAKLFGTVAQTAVRAVVGGETDAEKDEKAAKVGQAVGVGVKLGTAVSANVRDFAQTVSKSRGRVGEILEFTDPFLVEEFGKSSRAKLLRTGNEVITNARRQAMGQTRNDIYGAAGQLVDKVPTVISALAARHKELAALREVDADSQHDDALDAADSALVTLTEEVSNQDEPFDIDAASEKVISDAKKRFQEKFDAVADSDAFAAENVKTVNLLINSGSPFIKEYFEDVNAETYGNQSAYEMIVKLVDMARTGNGNVSSVQVGKNNYRLADYIMEIFKQHQEDMGQTPINDRFQSADELQAACQTIADEINKNLLDPIALIGLVGEREILDKHLRVAGPLQVQEALQKSWRVLERSEQVDVPEFIADTVFGTADEFKTILKDMPAEDKPFFVSLWPSAVLRDAGGMKVDEIAQYKDQAAGEFAKDMGEAISRLAELEPKELQQYGLTRAEATLIQKLANDLEMGDERFEDALTGQTRKDAVRAVGNAAGYWSERINGEARSRRSETQAGVDDESVRPSLAERIRAEEAPDRER